MTWCCFDALLTPINWLYLAIPVVLYLSWKLKQPKYNLPPGPTGWPIVGNLLSFRGGTSVYILLMDVAKKYGPILTIYVGHRRTIVISNNELALDAYVKKPHDIAGRPYFPSAEWMTDGFKDITLSDPGPAWRLHRKIAAKALRSYISGPKLEENLHDCLSKVIELIRNEKTAFDPYEHLSLFVYNFMAVFCWQASYDLHDSEFRSLIADVDIANETFGNGLPEDFIGILKYLPNKRREILKKAFGSAMKLLKKKFKEAKSSFYPDKRRHLIDELILAQQSHENQDEVQELLTEAHLVQTLSNVFFAGTETSRYTAYWCILYMAAHPDVQTRIQDEIDSVVASGMKAASQKLLIRFASHFTLRMGIAVHYAPQGHDRLPCLNDREALAYTDATLHEVMRIRPLVPLGLPHKCLNQTTLGGYNIPKGTDVMVSIWSLHNDPAYWKDPDQFNPDRFVENGRLIPKRDSYMPFSAGRRGCLGEAVAKPVLFIFFAGLLQHFRVEPETKVDLEPLHEFGLSVYPKRARLTMTPRF